jgi:hypothetical protein
MLWPDNRTGIDQLYTAPITVAGKAVMNGDPELSALRDVTKQISVDVTSNNRKPGSDTFSVTVRLHNAGKDTIFGPLKARVTSLEERYTVLYVVNADNGRSDAGAVWDFTSLLPNGRLLPGDSTGEKTLILRSPLPSEPMTTPATRDNPPEMRYGVFLLRMRVLAK